MHPRCTLGTLSPALSTLQNGESSVRRPSVIVNRLGRLGDSGDSGDLAPPAGPDPFWLLAHPRPSPRGLGNLAVRLAALDVLAAIIGLLPPREGEGHFHVAALQVQAQGY